MRFLRVGCFHSDDPLSIELLTELQNFVPNPRISDGSRTRMIGDMPIILRNILPQPGSDAYLLDFARVREARNLPLSDLKGNESEIRFNPEDPRPADRTAAVLDLPSRCLLIQENGTGISHSTVGKYFKNIAQCDRLRFKLVMDGAAQARMLKSGGFEKLSIGLAKLGNVADLAGYGFSDTEILKLTSGISATKLNISFGVERRRDGEMLDTEAVIDFATRLVGLPSQYLRSLRLTPVDIDEDGLAIDLVNDRILVKHPVTAQESEELEDAVRYRAVNAAWRKYRDVLRERYGR